MLDRFTGTAKLIVSEARDLATSLNHSEIHNEHLLKIMLSHKKSLAWKVLALSETPWELIQQDIDAVLSRETESDNSAFGFDIHVKKTIEMAFRQVEELHYTWISSALILYGILNSGSESSRRLLNNWGITSDWLIGLLKESGDLPGSIEDVTALDTFTAEFHRRSSTVTDNLEKILAHSKKLAATYSNEQINFYHIYLSYAFLAVRKIVNIHPIDPSVIDMEQVKKIASDKLPPEDTEEPFPGYSIHSREVCDIFRTAVKEALILDLRTVDVLPLTVGMIRAYPEEMKQGMNLDYDTICRVIWEKNRSVEQQPTVKTGAVKGVERNSVVPQISLRRYNADPGAVITIPQKLAEEWNAVALSVQNNTVTVAMANPDDVEIIAKIRELSGLDVAVVRATLKDIRSALKMYY